MPPIITLSLLLLTTSGASMNLLLVYVSLRWKTPLDLLWATRLLLFILMASSLELVPLGLSKIWDVKSHANVTKFDGHIGAATAISFSDNGYFLATAAQDSVKLWDLHKLKNFKTLAPYDENTAIQSVEFDNSGSYLALGGSDIRLYQVASIKSEWNCIKTFPDLSGTGKATCVKFGPDAKYIVVGSMDQSVRIFGLPEEDGPSES